MKLPPGNNGKVVIAQEVMKNRTRRSSSLSSFSESESEGSYGASLYGESRFYEFDRYKQKPRRRESLENTWVNMEIYGDMKKVDNRKLEFKPAAGCTNASDYIVRCFAARLRQGFTVTKHNRNRRSKSQPRIIFLHEDGTSLTWNQVQRGTDSGKRVELDLSKCREVRHAWSPDPNTRRCLGTAVLR